MQQYCRDKSEIVWWEIWNDSWSQIHVLNWQKSFWTNWGCASGQTGGATNSALATTRNDCHKFFRCPGLLHMVQNPIMYDTWGGASNIFSARSLWSQITRSGGVRSPDWHSCQSGNLTRSDAGERRPGSRVWCRRDQPPLHQTSLSACNAELHSSLQNADW